jgi:protein phosphatase
VRPELDLFLVADGMGGHNAGDVASALAAKSMDNFFEATRYGEIPGEPPEDERALPHAARRLAASVRKANRDVFEISSTFQQHHGMGSTIVAAHYDRDAGVLHVAHVGDSRAYRVRSGVIEQLTHDHSLVNDALALKPDLKPEELARLPRNIITRALGMKEVVKVDLCSIEVEPGDVYLLCSDGLSGMVPDAQILELIEITEDLRETCDLLVALANEAGGSDNISAVCVRFEAHEEEARDADAGDAALPRLEGIVPKEIADALVAGAEVDISAPPSSPPPSGSGVRCERCRAEVLEGNVFCVECGAPIA